MASLCPPKRRRLYLEDQVKIHRPKSPLKTQNTPNATQDNRTDEDPSTETSDSSDEEGTVKEAGIEATDFSYVDNQRANGLDDATQEHSSRMNVD